MKNEWRYDKPPNEVNVEVEEEGRIIVAYAFHGRDGYLPHWVTSEGVHWSPDKFVRWREIK